MKKLTNNRKKLVIGCFFLACLAAACAFYFLRTGDSDYIELQPPYVYKAATNNGSYRINGRGDYGPSAGVGNWEIEYILSQHDGSPIEANIVSGNKEPQPYAEKNDIGVIRFTAGKDNPYVDDIVSVWYELDWLKDYPLMYGIGRLDIESGFLKWENGNRIVDGFGYRNDVREHRMLTIWMHFDLTDGRYVDEFANLWLQK